MILIVNADESIDCLVEHGYSLTKTGNPFFPFSLVSEEKEVALIMVKDDLVAFAGEDEDLKKLKSIFESDDIAVYAEDEKEDEDCDDPESLDDDMEEIEKNIEDDFTDGQAYFRDDETGEKTYLPWKRPKFPPIKFYSPDDCKKDDESKDEENE